MADGVPSGNQLWLIAIVLIVTFVDVFCGDGSLSYAKPATPAPTNNAWKIPNQNTQSAGNPNWAGIPPSSTTPWPELGQRKQPNRQNSATTNQNSQTQNRNVGHDLSYGSNQQSNRPIAPNNQPNRGGYSNVGLDLSYGPGQAQIVPKRTQNGQENLNQAKPVQNTNQQTKPAQSTNPVTPNKQDVPVNTNQGVWSNQGKTQQVIQNLQPGAAKPAQPSIASPLQPFITKPVQPSIAKPIQPNQPSTPKSVQAFTPKPVQMPASTVGPTSLNPSSVSSSTPKNEDEEFRQFFEQLIKKDNSNVMQHVMVNYQGKTTSRSQNDEAPQPLLSIKQAAYQVPSISKLLALHNNYILETNVNEHVTAQERGEENALLDVILATNVMQYARNFLVQKGIISKDPKDFRDKIKEIWFNMYSRGEGKIGSSGFEHVFLAEIKGKDISGLHNWIYFKDAEEKGKANYLGYMNKFDLGNKGSIIKHHFTLNGIDKPVGSMFIGTSPELELALYSTCFLLRADKVCPLRYEGKNFIIRTYTFRYRGKNMIGSAFPEI